MAHIVAVLALDGVVAYDLAIPCGVFGHVMAGDGTPHYEVKVCGEARTVRSRDFALAISYGLETIVGADTLVIPGVDETDSPVSPAVVDAVRGAWAAGARIASICSGAFVLAATGLLDGRQATTHWLGAKTLASRYPRIAVDPNVLYVDEGRIITSAGASAGMDMCLHLIRRDHGQAVAMQAARLAVAPLDREGGQAQYIRHEPPRTNASLAPVLEWMTVNAGKPLTFKAMASEAGMSARTFARRFREQTGTTPMQWFLSVRLRRAQELLETSRASIDQIATAAGFSSPVTFRSSFRRMAGLSPAAYRDNFKTRDTNQLHLAKPMIDLSDHGPRLNFSPGVQ